MSTAFIFSTFLEISAVLFLVWGFYNEDKLIDFEDKFAWLVAAYIRKVKKQKAHKKQMQTVSATNVRTASGRNLHNVVYDSSNFAA
ncbi:MAG: hypothetical protein RR911_03445 [Oscillospiraceae bacterium]